MENNFEFRIKIKRIDKLKNELITKLKENFQNITLVIQANEHKFKFERCLEAECKISSNTSILNLTVFLFSENKFSFSKDFLISFNNEDIVKKIEFLYNKIAFSFTITKKIYCENNLSSDKNLGSNKLEKLKLFFESQVEMMRNILEKEKNELAELQNIQNIIKTKYKSKKSELRKSKKILLSKQNIIFYQKSLIDDLDKK